MVGILATEGGSDSNTMWVKTLKYYTISLFTLFLVIYIIILYMLTTRLKRYFPKFYLKESTKIYTSNGIIIFSIVSRISVNVYSTIYQSEMDISYGAGTWFYPLY